MVYNFKIKEMRSKIFNGIKNSIYFKQILILAVGTVIAKIIPLIISPLLTRIYSPPDFGTLAVFTAFITAISPVICGRYEVATVLPKNNEDGLQLLGISLWFSIVLSLLFLFFILTFRLKINLLIDTTQLNKWLYLIPLVLFLNGFISAVKFYAMRFNDYSIIARADIVYASVVAVVSLIYGFINNTFVGLVMGMVVGVIISALFLWFKYKNVITIQLFGGFNEKLKIAKKFIDYPIYNASGSLLNGFTMAMPVFFLMHYFPESVVGYFSLGLRVVNSPLSLISGAISQVNLKKVVDLVNNNKSVKPYLIRVTVSLTCLVVLPTIVFAIYAPVIFRTVFGEKWFEAGVYMQILIPAIAIKFISSTVSSTLGATQNNFIGAFWRVISFVVTIGVLALFCPMRDKILIFKAIAVMDILLYVFYYYIIWKAASNPKNK